MGIKEKLKQIEKEENIKILFFVESGSRAWGIESDNSDYDIRFVYVRPIDDYLQIHLKGDVISKHYSKKFEPMAAEGCYYDLNGFDIFKFVRMLASSNPTVIEWLRSKILYYGEIPKVFKEYAEEQFKPISLYFHYKSMCRQNYLKYLKTSNIVTYKKYLYAMRGLVNAKLVAHTNKLPSINFPEALWDAKDKNLISKEIYFKMKDIIALKKDSREKQIIRNLVVIDSYIEGFLKSDEEAPRDKRLGTLEELNKELRRLIRGK